MRLFRFVRPKRKKWCMRWVKMTSISILTHPKNVYYFFHTYFTRSDNLFLLFFSFFFWQSRYLCTLWNKSTRRFPSQKKISSQIVLYYTKFILIFLANTRRYICDFWRKITHKRWSTEVREKGMNDTLSNQMSPLWANTHEPHTCVRPYLVVHAKCCPTTREKKKEVSSWPLDSSAPIR